MKVLTIKQPWATLIMQGNKRFEFRSWQTKYRGELLIHAGKGIDKEAIKRLSKYLPKELPLGKILGKVTLVDCIKMSLEFKVQLLKENHDIYTKSSFKENYINNRISLKILSDKKYKDELLKFIKTFDSTIVRINTSPNSIEEVRNNNGVIKVELVHQGEDGKSKALPLALESNGTMKMFHLFDYFMDALRNGMVLFVDELDTKLHPLLTRYIINLFHNSETNVGNGQLIYSTHDTVNLNKETFRRDEIWFVEKNNDGISDIYSLSDYVLDSDEEGKGKKVRNDATYNKDYLTGRYGAIPVLEEFNIYNER